MRTILEFTTETVSKYWDSADYRLFTLKMNSSGHLILISSNRTNSKLYGFSESSIGKSLYEIMPKEHAERWHVRFQEWKKNRLTSYMAYFEDNSMAWDTTLEIVNNTVFAIGKKINPESLDLEAFEKHELFNHYYIHQEDFIIITLSQSEGSFLIESLDCSYADDTTRYIGQDISSVTLYCSNILDQKVYRKCLQTKKAIHFAEKVIKDNKTLFLDVSLYPYIKNSKIIIYAKIINEALYHQIQKQISNIYGAYPETDYLGICEINYEDETKPYMIGCNNYFKRILEKTDLELTSIISSKPFQKCLETLSTETAILSIQNNQSEFNQFKVSVTHSSEIRNHIFVVTLVPVNLELVNIDFNFSKLSSREKEILNYVANGFTNRYIAKALGITEGTVKKTVYNGYKKLGVCSRVELVKSLKGQLEEPLKASLPQAKKNATELL